MVRRVPVIKPLLVACTIFLQVSHTAHGAASPASLNFPLHNEAQCMKNEHECCAQSHLKLLNLRGGFGVIGISGTNNIKPTSSQSRANLGTNSEAAGPTGPATSATGGVTPTGGASGSTTPRGTAFTKIVYTKVPGETPRTVEVAGSWSNFKQRNAMTRNAAGDFEIIMELPRGQHDVKFVINGETWRCHPSMEARRDGQGNQNNVIHVDNVAIKRSLSGVAVERKPSEVFVPQKSSIDIARDVVLRLELEKKTAQEKLAKAHQQLVQTLVEELTAGQVSLEKSKKLVSSFNDTATAGSKLVRKAGDAKMNEIRAHMSKIRQILDQKEQIALDTVEADMKRRLGVLATETTSYGAVVPELASILEHTDKALKLAKTDATSFITQANALVSTIQDKTSKAAALKVPTDNADFENLSLNLLPPGST